MPDIDRALLWAAWLNGYLAMRGVQTVRHWQCRWMAMSGRFAEFILDTGEEPREEQGLGHIRRILVASGRPRRGDEGEHARGDLLPLVSIRDTATWACLLRDLTRAAQIKDGHQRSVTASPARAIGWVRELDGSWHLSAMSHDIRDLGAGAFGYHIFRSLKTEDPALALVKARIQLRQEAGTDQTV